MLQNRPEQSIRKAVEWVQEKLSIKLADKQVEPVECACQSKVMVLTGQPGTGKTTIINSILKNLPSSWGQDSSGCTNRESGKADE